MPAKMSRLSSSSEHPTDTVTISAVDIELGPFSRPLLLLLLLCGCCSDGLVTYVLLGGESGARGGGDGGHSVVVIDGVADDAELGDGDGADGSGGKRDG